MISTRRYRDAVLRDLRWLMNTPGRPPGDEIYEFDQAATSVLNYGVHDLSGVTAAGIRSEDVEREMLQSIRLFEPRILSTSLKVKATQARERMDVSALSFEIVGDLWAQPVPEHLFIKTELDLETGQCDVKLTANG